MDTTIENMINSIDLSAPVPEYEPMRQYPGKAAGGGRAGAERLLRKSQKHLTDHLLL